MAASIDFDLPVQQAANSNVTSAHNILALAKECEGLESFVHCSTAYTMLPKEGNGAINEDHVDSFANGKAGQIYKAIKRGALTESLLVEQRGRVPLVIVRPSIVTACYQFPHPGWIDSRAALAAFIAMYGTGFLHTIPAKADVQLDVVPCDCVAERLIHGALAPMDRTSQAVVIHDTAGQEHSLTVGEIVAQFSRFFKLRQRHTQQRPYIRVMAESTNPQIAKSFQKDKRKVIRLKRMAKLFGKQKAAKSLDKVSTGLDKVFSFFTHNSFNFQSKQTITDVFPCFEKSSFMDTVNMGVYHYLLGGKELPEPCLPCFKVKNVSVILLSKNFEPEEDVTSTTGSSTISDLTEEYHGTSPVLGSRKRRKTPDAFYQHSDILRSVVDC
ncbi:Fatty acyl-CoA reductase 1 [Seminavis robusta]|uniref:Fatty acyl-CoA reductase n=1 Tax=Seminavis robusta TaxID=568900 RepID=A0A9N8DNC8_9STRA|nr:Fatty acyl-CoA reductase 1 [Seminavis robusta]|eukprot:Sro257_g100840.1 Fatty acyl-CoA reductase 1 (384) ;mRNA; f:26196-27418